MRRTGKALLVAAAVLGLRHAVTAHRKHQIARDGKHLGECSRGMCPGWEWDG